MADPATLSAIPAQRIDAAYSNVRRHSLILFGILGATFLYLAYAFFAFDAPSLIASAKPERALLLATDAVAYKTHVTKSLRTGETEVAIEAERNATYDHDDLPAWVTLGDKVTEVDLADGYRVEIEDRTTRFTVPDYGLITVTVTPKGIVTEMPPGPTPDWMRATKAKFDARPTLSRRVQVSRSKIEIHRFFFGWENFFFPFESELAGRGFFEVLGLMTSGERLNLEMSNFAYVFHTFWFNPDWQHGLVFVALLETLMMAVLGTITAAFVGLPLAFLAASNFTPSLTLRFFVRRAFDFLRGIDMLIWSLIFIRAFGLGPLTGALAIAFTDTGSLGKLFSEALENIDRKQVEGVSATGANRLQTYRFGVIPQVLPILISQGLYYLESNTRSATVIGALGAGGIGLMLVETMRTSRDWENTLYIIFLTVILVMVMDKLSSWLRRRLIEG